MLQLKIKLTLFYSTLFIVGFGFLCISNNNQVIAMNNNNLYQNNYVIQDVNIHEFNELENLLLQYNAINQQINNILNNFQDIDVNHLLKEITEIHNKITTVQRKKIHFQELILRVLDNKMTIIELERKHSSLIQKMMESIDIMDFYVNQTQINKLRNIQIKIDQNRQQMMLIKNQMYNYQNQINNI
ncbi:MAG: hypothetical protein Q8874_01045 [Sweet potato little leaf phytoplasma]|nr:hypothetical protein [Sweet potato little leaf phytoplasma]